MSINAINSSLVIVLDQTKRSVQMPAFKIPMGYTGVINKISWDFFSWQGLQDINIALNIGGLEVYRSGRFGSSLSYRAEGIDKPPYDDLTYDKAVPISKTRSGRGYDQASITVSPSSNFFQDNYPPIGEVYFVAGQGADITWAINNQSEVYNHTILVHLGGYFLPKEKFTGKEKLSPYALQRDPSLQKEITIYGNEELIAASSSVGSGDIPTIGLNHIKGLVYSDTYSVQLKIEEGIEDRGSTTYILTTTYNILAGTALPIKYETMGKFIKITITNLSGAGATNVKTWLSARKIY